MSKDKANLTNDPIANKQSFKPSIYQMRNKRPYRIFKPLMVASILAIIIGAFLGVIMLNMLVSLEENISVADEPVNTVTKNEEDTDASASTSSNDTTFSNLSAFVIQGGVFGDLDNVNKVTKKYAKLGLPAIIWEKDNQYFLLVGISETEEQASKLASDIKEKGKEAYVKEWHTEDREISLSDDEANWLSLFEEHWASALSTINDPEVSISEEWEKLISNLPESKGKLSSFAEEVKKIVEDNQKSSNAVEKQDVLLQMWLLYDQSLSKV